MTPANLGLGELPDGQPYGIIMDMDVDGDTATLTSFASGDASFYLSTGRIIIGGGEHAAVANAAKRFVAAAGQHLDRMARSDAQPRPAAGQVNFYVLTSEAVLAATRPEIDLGERGDSLSPLFYAGHDVITQLRLIDERLRPN